MPNYITYYFMRIIQRIVVIAVGIFIAAFFIPTVWNIICNGNTLVNC